MKQSPRWREATVKRGQSEPAPIRQNGGSNWTGAETNRPGGEIKKLCRESYHH